MSVYFLCVLVYILNFLCIHDGVVGGGNIVDGNKHDRLPATNDRANRPGLGGPDIAPQIIWMRQRGALLLGTEYNT